MLFDYIQRLFLDSFKYLLYATRQRKISKHIYPCMVSKALPDSDTNAIANTSVPIASFPQDSSAQRGSYFSLEWIGRKRHVRGVNDKSLKQMTFQLFPLN